MRAALVGRPDLTERLVGEKLLPSFAAVSTDDVAYRARLLVQIAPAMYRVQPTSSLKEIETLDPNYRDYAIRQIIRFLLTARVPSDPVDRNAEISVETNFETLLQVHELTTRLDTDWMIYATAEDIADIVHSARNKQTITVPQKEDLGRRFAKTAKTKLPMTRHITVTEVMSEENAVFWAPCRKLAIFECRTVTRRAGPRDGARRRRRRRHREPPPPPRR